jgi:hypothetical protein
MALSSLAIMLLAVGLCLPLVILWAHRFSAVPVSCAPGALVDRLADCASAAQRLVYGAESPPGRAPPATPASVVLSDFGGIAPPGVGG